MTKTFILKNLDCAHCASKMQDAIRKLEGVNDVTINFMTSKMILDAEDDKYEEILDTAKKLIKKYEPKVSVSL